MNTYRGKSAILSKNLHKSKFCGVPALGGLRMRGFAGLYTLYVLSRTESKKYCGKTELLSKAGVPNLHLGVLTSNLIP
jgi:hypothetical protein